MRRIEKVPAVRLAAEEPGPAPLELAHYDFARSIVQHVRDEMDREQRRRWQGVLAMISLVASALGGGLYLFVKTDLLQAVKEQLDDRFAVLQGTTTGVPLMLMEIDRLTDDSGDPEGKASFSDAEAEEWIAKTARLAGVIERIEADLERLGGVNDVTLSQVEQVKIALADTMTRIVRRFSNAARYDYVFRLYETFPEVADYEPEFSLRLITATGVLLLSEANASAWAEDGPRRAEYLAHRDGLRRHQQRFPEFVVVWGLLIGREDGYTEAELAELGYQAGRLSDRDLDNLFNVLGTVVASADGKSIYALAEKRVRALLVAGCAQGWAGPTICDHPRRADLLRRIDGPVASGDRTDEGARVLVADVVKPDRLNAPAYRALPAAP